MKIKDIGTLDLNETTFKLSDKSITARVNSKTKAVINDIQSVKGLPFNRKVDLNIKFKSGLNNFFDGLYIDLDNTLYYIIDNNYHKLACKSAEHGYPNDINKIMDKVAILSGFNVNVLYLDVA